MPVSEEVEVTFFFGCELIDDDAGVDDAHNII